MYDERAIWIIWELHSMYAVCCQVTKEKTKIQNYAYSWYNRFIEQRRVGEAWTKEKGNRVIVLIFYALKRFLKFKKFKLNVSLFKTWMLYSCLMLYDCCTQHKNLIIKIFRGRESMYAHNIIATDALLSKEFHF